MPFLFCCGVSAHPRPLSWGQYLAELSLVGRLRLAIGLIGVLLYHHVRIALARF
ncbi:hypothetical protein NLM33_31315 [Bradyrhizobium sp. CCGUVB1N3]|uniref:hypothetical protein n=1 Tax=Bradyrhizobium sp. CCGUVB1N3 TaxID=2949629 RepID=UPI0020B400AD|nr:hypothetical protein [Bradyrhizobium sp. CCGUVB1N3]MCP3474811.1 hypothetical protein [Bradyrhizobium sp. CCGUVB1N3]